VVIIQRFTERFFSSGCGGLSIIPQIAFCPVQLPFLSFCRGRQHRAIALRGRDAAKGI
jgi:hypothetical protein